MKVLATFSNAGEAGFVQSLLAEEGIVAELDDGAFDVGGVKSVRLRVADEDLARAEPIVAAHRAAAGPTVEAKRDEHPTTRFPFLAVTAGFAVLWCAANVSFVVLKVAPSDLWSGDGTQVLARFTVIVTGSLLWGVVLGLGVAVIALAGYTTWRKLKTNSPR